MGSGVPGAGGAGSMGDGAGGGPGSSPAFMGAGPGGAGMGRMPMGMHGMSGYQSPRAMGPGVGPVGALGPGMGTGGPTGSPGGMRMMGSGMGMSMPGSGQYPGMIRPGSMMEGRMPVSTSSMMGIGSQPSAPLQTPASLQQATGSLQTSSNLQSPAPLQTSAPLQSAPNAMSSNINVDAAGSTDGGQGGEAGAQQQQKEVNTSTICRIGQETVEEIVARTLEVFSILKSLQPPVGSYTPQTTQNDRGITEKQNRLQEVLKGIGMLFKRLRVCWDKCEESTATIEHVPLINLIPVKDESDSCRTDLEKKRGDTYKSALEEHNELIQQIVLKNRHLKDIIDQMRNTIWEINTMLAMRTS